MSSLYLSGKERIRNLTATDKTEHVWNIHIRILSTDYKKKQGKTNEHEAFEGGLRI